jgi:hypothetical protein
MARSHVAHALLPNAADFSGRRDRRTGEPRQSRSARANRAAAALAAAIFLTTGCGYIDPPLTPLANVPDPVSDLVAMQRGVVLMVHCSVPTRTTENVLLKTPPRFDLRIGTAGERFNVEEWAGRAQAVSDARLKDGLASWEIPATEWTGKRVAIGARAIGSNGKKSNWSNPVIVPVVAPPEVPSPPILNTTPIGIQVTWTGRGDQFRVLRRTGNDEGYIVAVTAAGHEWTDTGIEYGKTYTYRMQALVDVGGNQVAESDFSATAEETPKDRFAPAVPSGLSADPTPNSIALSWVPDTEPDLAGYRVYRAVGDGPMQKLADQNTIPSYTDSAVERGKTYHYAVSAVDKAGNESDRSAAVAVVL